MVLYGGDQGGAETGQDYYRKKEQTNKEYYREILNLANRDKVGVKPMTYAEDDDAEDAENLEEYLATPGGGFVLVKRYVCRTRLFSCRIGEVLS